MVVEFPIDYNPQDPLFANAPLERWEQEWMEVSADYDGWSYHPDGEAILNFW